MPTTYAIPNGRTVMNAITYSGTSATRNISNADLGTTGFKPDLVWSKSRTNPSSGYLNILCDTVRGQTSGYSNMLFSDATYTENAGGGANPPSTGGITTFNSNGYTLANGSGPGYWQNESGYNYVAWQWQAGQGTNTTNTSGILTSTVSVNATAGFSVATYTAPSSSQANSFGHGLGVAPAFVIAKNRSSGTGGLGWAVYHQSLGANQYLSLNSTAAAATYSGYWGSGMTSTVVGLPTGASSTGFDNCTGNMVAYCWAEIAGFSQFGSYTGNGSADGPFVYLGFRPRWVLWKRTDSASGNGWYLLDSARNPSNVAGERLFPNLANAGSNDTQVDFLSNGFKLRTTDTDSNGSGGTYIYAAFAENPFKYANAR